MINKLSDKTVGVLSIACFLVAITLFVYECSYCAPDSETNTVNPDKVQMKWSRDELRQLIKDEIDIHERKPIF